MVESQLKAMNPDLYERLIDRLGLALDVARTAVRLRDETPAELELRGLSRAEFELINAYLDASRTGARADSAAQACALAPFEPPKELAKVYWLKERRAAKRPGKRGHWQYGKL